MEQGKIEWELHLRCEFAGCRERKVIVVAIRHLGMEVGCCAADARKLEEFADSQSNTLDEAVIGCRREIRALLGD